MTEIKTEKCIACDEQVFWAKIHGQVAENSPKLPFLAEPTEFGGFSMDFTGAPHTKQYVSAKHRVEGEVLYARHRHSQDEIARAKLDLQLARLREKNASFR